MGVVLRLMRAGAKKRPFYRVVAADSRRQRDGRFLEIVGHYDPLRTPFELVIEKDRVEGWLKNGATPSTQVASLLRKAGMTLGRQKAAKKKVAAAAGKRTHARKRVVSARKVKAKAARKAGKKPAAKAAKAKK